MKTVFNNGPLTIRPFTNEDIPLLLEAVLESQSELSLWMPWCHPAYSIHDTEKFVRTRADAWAKDEDYSFAIVDAETDCFFGTVSINRIIREDQVGNIGYWIRTSETRNGLGSTAARMVADFGLNEAKLTRLEILTSVNNIASQRAAEKAGARREGVLRKRLLLCGQAHDAVVFSFIADDLKA